MTSSFFPRKSKKVPAVIRGATSVDVQKLSIDVSGSTSTENGTVRIGNADYEILGGQEVTGDAEPKRAT